MAFPLDCSIGALAPRCTNRNQAWHKDACHG
jgi:hypothetical protein